MTTETSNARGEWVLVPREITQEMRDAGNRAIRTCDTEPGMGVADRAFYAYTAMLAAAPPPAAARGDVRGLVGWRVMRVMRSAGTRPHDTWEVYDPQGSGGVVSDMDVKNWIVRELLNALAAEGVQAGEVYVDFPQVGIAGPFPVEGGKVTLPDVTMNDLIQHARIGHVSQQPEARGVVDVEAIRRACQSGKRFWQAGPGYYEEIESLLPALTGERNG